MSIRTYGDEFVPWGRGYTGSDAATSITGGGTTLGAWTEIEDSTQEAYYPTHVVGSSTTVLEIGYGPVGGELVVAQGISVVPLPVPGDLIPKGARVVMRTVANGWFTPIGVRALGWAPTLPVGGPRYSPVTPQLTNVSVTAGSWANLVNPLLYPFILTNIVFSGSAGTGPSSLTIGIAGAVGTETPVLRFPVFRGDNTPQLTMSVNPRPHPFPAGARIVARTGIEEEDSGDGDGFLTLSVLISGLRIDQ